jgi:hypothetical protein
LSPGIQNQPGQQDPKFKTTTTKNPEIKGKKGVLVLVFTLFIEAVLFSYVD